MDKVSFQVLPHKVSFKVSPSVDPEILRFLSQFLHTIFKLYQCACHTFEIKLIHALCSGSPFTASKITLKIVTGAVPFISSSRVRSIVPLYLKLNMVMCGDEREHH